MEIKCKNNPYYNFSYTSPQNLEEKTFRGGAPINRAVECADVFVKRPVAKRSATGLLSIINSVKNFVKNYINNVKHTYDHKVIFALVEKELLGKNSIDSITHDADKLFLYILGFPKAFVSDFHRKHSVHHTESGKKINLRSMICDNIASSPEFKPEKKLSLRNHYNNSKALQSVNGFKELLEKYNYGENLDFNKIKAKKDSQYKGFYGVTSFVAKALMLII